MVVLLQGYLRVSDAEAVVLSVTDARWQLVLDCMGVEESPFAPGVLQRFRGRLLAAGMDRRLLERTIEPQQGWLCTSSGLEANLRLSSVLDSDG